MGPGEPMVSASEMNTSMTILVKIPATRKASGYKIIADDAGEAAEDKKFRKSGVFDVDPASHFGSTSITFST